MNDTAAGCHPLNFAGMNHAFVAETVMMLDASFKEVGDGFNTAMRVPWEPFQVIGRIVGTEIIKQQKWVEEGYTVFTYIIAGKGYFSHNTEPFSFDTEGVSYFDMETGPLMDNETLVLYRRDGDHVHISTENSPVRFLLFSGKPLHEPVAWHGPIVMNTREELQKAFEEYNNGTFLKEHQARP